MSECVCVHHMCKWEGGGYACIDIFNQVSCVEVQESTRIFQLFVNWLLSKLGLETFECIVIVLTMGPFYA